MRVVERVRRWAAGLTGRLGRSDREVEEELRFHVDMAARRNVERGMTPEAARRDALLRFGGVERTREAARDGRRGRWLEDAWQDVRHTVRHLGRTPGFTLAAILTLAMGTGANAAIFGVLDAVLLRPLPYAEPSALVALEPGRYDRYGTWAGARTLQSSGAYTYAVANVAGGAEPVRVWTLAVTASLLPTLGRAPLLGRNFSPEDDRQGAPPRVLLRHGFWRTHFAADASLVGRTIDVDGLAHEVIGVLPPDLAFPPPARRGDGSMPRDADLWIGIGRLPDLSERGGIFAVGRLAPGADAAAAGAELTRITGETRGADVPVTVQGVEDAVEAPVRPALIAFAAGVALVLLVACANLSSLLLARLTARDRELAVRRALGAPTGRIVRQILTESAVLAGAGCATGMAVAWLLLRGLVAFAPPELARVHEATVDARVLVFMAAAAVTVALLVGMLPALRAARRDPGAVLGGTRGAVGGRGVGRAHGVLVASEVAFAVVLLVGGGLLLRSFASLAAVSPGFDTAGLVTADILVPSDRYEDRAAVLRFFEALETRVGALPGVRAVSAIDRLPYGPSWSGLSFDIVGRPTSPATAPRASNAAARPDYFRTMGIPIVRGRGFAAADAADAPPVVVIGRALADRDWPAGDAIGARVVVWGVEREVVGVAGDVRHLGPTSPPEPMLYLPHAQDVVTRRMMTVAVRSDPAAPLPLDRLRAEIRALDPLLAVSNLRGFDALRAERTAGQRFNALIVASFAALATGLAAVGIHGVTSFVVAQRRREIGVRMALGASRAAVLGLFLRLAARAAAAGAAAGMLLALPLSRLLRSLLFGVGPNDPVTWAGVIALVVLLVVAAALLPARRAAAADPSRVLAAD